MYSQRVENQIPRVWVKNRIKILVEYARIHSICCCCRQGYRPRCPESWHVSDFRQSSQAVKSL